jgi:hypothetical protein
MMPRPILACCALLFTASCAQVPTPRPGGPIVVTPGVTQPVSGLSLEDLAVLYSREETIFPQAGLSANPLWFSESLSNMSQATALTPLKGYSNKYLSTKQILRRVPPDIDALSFGLDWVAVNGNELESLGANTPGQGVVGWGLLFYAGSQTSAVSTYAWGEKLAQDGPIEYSGSADTLDLNGAITSVEFEPDFDDAGALDALDTFAGLLLGLGQDPDLEIPPGATSGDWELFYSIPKARPRPGDELEEPVGATVYRLYLTSSGWQEPVPVFKYHDLGLDVADDIDALAYDKLRKRMLISLTRDSYTYKETPSEIYVVHLDTATASPLMIPDGLPPIPKIGDISGLCGLDPRIWVSDARPKD